MPKFACTVCGSDFSVPQTALDKFKGWTPKYCREHSPKKKPARRRGGGGRGRGRNPDGVEENLTTAQVLAKYSGGPQSGVFTDGGSVPNPGPGGWGVVWVEEGEIRDEKHGRHEQTTNNRMELTALIEAFRMLPEDSTAVVHTDSKLCVDTIETWAAGWEAKGWKRKSGPIKNLDLVKDVMAARRARPGCTLQWIAAHSGNRWNEYADSLASAWRRDEV